MILLAGVGQMTNTIYAPAMGLMSSYFNELPTRIQTVMGLFLLPYGLSQFIYGPLSDRFGRRPVILLGLLIYIIGSLATILTKHFNDLLLGSFLQGIGIGVGGVMARTVLRDLYSGQLLHRASSMASIGLIFAPLIAPVLGGVLANSFGWRAVFIFLMIFGIVVLILEYCFFPETNRLAGHADTHLTKVFSSYYKVLKNKQFLGFMICLMVSFAGVSVFEASAGILFTEVMHFTPAQASLLYIIPLPAYLFGSFLSGYLGRFYALAKIILLGIILLMIGALSVLVAGLIFKVNPYTILIPINFSFLAVGVLFPAATTGALDPFASLAGTAGSTLGGTQNIGAGIAILASATVRQNSQIPLGIILTVLAIIVTIIYYYSLHNKVPLLHTGEG